MEKTRAFICIDFPKEIIEEISRVQAQIPKEKFKGKLTKPEHIHLTLKFLGEINENTLSKVKLALSKISFPSFQASLQESGTFSKRNNPRIVWIKINGKEIMQLQNKIDDALSPIFPKEKRFMSHLTIARIKHANNPKEFINQTRKLKVKPLAFEVNSFKLKSSKLAPEGPVYETLKTFSLTNP